MRTNQAPELPQPHVRLVWLGLLMFGFWLVLSGRVEALFLALGVASAAAAALIGRRMVVVDHEGYPFHLTARVLTYLPWLGLEVIRSNIDVARRILSPRMPISPRVFRVRVSQHSALGKVIYANSITLTPGTVSMEVSEDEIVVHALTEEAATALQGGEMDGRVTRMLGEGGD